MEGARSSAHTWLIFPTRALEQRRADTSHLPQGVHQGRPAILQPPQPSLHAGAPRGDPVPVARSVQVVEPEPRARGRAHHFLQLRSSCKPPARRGHSGPGESEAGGGVGCGTHRGCRRSAIGSPVGREGTPPDPSRSGEWSLRGVMLAWQANIAKLKSIWSFVGTGRGARGRSSPPDWWT